MTINDEQDCLDSPIFGLLIDLGFSHFGEPRYFNIGSLFWSLSRLFVSYNRICGPLYLKQKVTRPYIESDIENFIIRHAIILNDVAYIIWQLLPKNIRGLECPGGPVHPADREMRIEAIIKYINKNRDKFTSLFTIFEKNKDWINFLKKERDNIIHFK